MRVDEPEKRIKRKEIYADVLIRIKDEVLIGKYFETPSEFVSKLEIF